MIRHLSFLLACSLLWGCVEEDTPTGDDTRPYTSLSTYGFFTGPLADLNHAPGVVPFAPVSPLFSDDTGKDRFIVLPEGAQITFDAEDRWVFPDGAIVGKTFYYDLDANDPSAGRQILETRLFERIGGEWKAHVYVWNEDQTDAEYLIIGKSIPTTRVDRDGNTVELEYRVPNVNQCKSCHGQDGDIQLLGPRTRQLNSMLDVGNGPENQLTRMEAAGMFDASLPTLDSLPALTGYHDESLTVEQRARNYLEANCAHCHNPGGLASPSGLKLGINVDNPYDYGVCRTPVAAGSGSGGLFYDIVPGAPEESILVFRMNSLDPDVKMPELPTQTIDPLGLQLVTDWVASMPAQSCGTEP